MVLKIGLKYSLILFSLTTLLFNLYNLSFNVQHIEQFGLFHRIYNPFYYATMYVLILILAIKEIIKISEINFYKILSISFLIILFNYFFEYLGDWMFYYLNEIINKPMKTTQNQPGLLGLLSEFQGIFSKPQFRIFDYLLNEFINSFTILFYFLMNLELIQFFYTVISSKLILTTFVIYSYSLFILFERFNKKGIYSIIPIKNNLIMLSITSKPAWWILPLYLPFIRIVPKYLINKEISSRYNHSNLFAVGMTLLPWFFYGKLVFDKK